MFDNEKDLFGETGLDLGNDFTEILDGENPFADDPIESISAEIESADAAKSETSSAQPQMSPESPQNTNSAAAVSAVTEQADMAETKEEEQNDAQTDLQKDEPIPVTSGTIMSQRAYLMRQSQKQKPKKQRIQKAA